MNAPVPDDEPFPPGPHLGPGNGFGKLSIGSGFPKMEPPVFVFDQRLRIDEDSLGRRRGARAPSDAESIGDDKWLISDPAKQLLERLDAEAFVFVPVRTIVHSREGEMEGPPYWLADVIRFLDAFDLESGAFNTLPDGRQRPRSLDVERFRPDMVGNAIFFRGLHYPRAYCRQVARDEIRAAKLKGFDLAAAGRINEFG